MPQIDTKPQPAKKVIDATVPGENPKSPVQNISEEEKKKLIAGWDKQSAERNVHVAREAAIPSTPTFVIRFELRQFRKHWNAYLIEGKKETALLPAPSLLVSALDALDDRINERAWKRERAPGKGDE
jgi:hypothetical protein